MPKTVTTPWDPAERLNTGEDMAAHLESALDDGDPTLVAAALGDIARAKRMTQVAREAGLGRESLYEALSPAGNPEFAIITKVVSALGLKLHACPAGAKRAVQPAGRADRQRLGQSPPLVRPTFQSTDRSPARARRRAHLTMA